MAIFLGIPSLPVLHAHLGSRLNCCLWLGLWIVKLTSQSHFPGFCELPLGRHALGRGLIVSWASQVVLGVKNPPADAGYVRDLGKILGQEDSPGGGHGNPLQSSCLGNAMDRGAWQAIVQKVANSQTWLKRLCTQTHHCTLPLSLGPSLYGGRRDTAQWEPEVFREGKTTFSDAQRSFLEGQFCTGLWRLRKFHQPENRGCFPESLAQEQALTEEEAGGWSGKPRGASPRVFFRPTLVTYTWVLVGNRGPPCSAHRRPIVKLWRGCLCTCQVFFLQISDLNAWFSVKILVMCFWFSDFKTLCFVQINVIDINDQIPIFEKSDVSSCLLVFALLCFYYLTPASGIKTQTGVRDNARFNILVNALLVNSGIVFSGNLPGTVMFTVIVSASICL